VTARFVGKKLIGSFLTLGFVLVFNFFLFRVVQTDPVGSLFRGRNVPQDRLDQMRVEFGLDKSLPEQFVAYLRETAQLNFGLSYQSRQPVWTEISDKIWPTVVLVGVAALLSAVIGVIGGIIAAWRRGSKTDYSITSSTMVFYSMPDFWLGMLLLVGFAVVLGWFPVGGLVDLGSNATGFARLLDQLHHLALPCLTLTLAYLGEYAVVMRSSLLDVMGEDYLTVARAKGLRDVQVRNRHAVPNALLPVVTLGAINLGFRAVGSDRGRDPVLVARVGQGDRRRHPRS
jgi:peptide/nickel transport system permease protein